MMFDQDAINDMVQIEITKAVASFAYKYGGQHNFQKQKFLFDLFNLKVPNNGYAKLRASEVFDEMILKLPEQMLSKDTDYEDEFLSSWLTELPNLLILAAEPFIQEGMPCWFVVYQMPSASCFFTVMVKYWEHRDPQCNFFRTDLSSE
jgi:hypothetical protein